MYSVPNFPFSSLDDALIPAHVNQSFSTYNRDNDANNAVNCADRLKGGWCTEGSSNDRIQSNPNGEYSRYIQQTRTKTIAA